MHRDTRLHEIVGDAVIIRSRQEDGSEVIRQATRPGGILSAQIAVLDDISRAPGEALNVLFRILNERRFAQGGDAASLSLPLITAIATGNPISDNSFYRGDALDPASLDRFTLQARCLPPTHPYSGHATRITRARRERRARLPPLLSGAGALDGPHRGRCVGRRGARDRPARRRWQRELGRASRGGDGGGD